MRESRMKVLFQDPEGSLGDYLGAPNSTRCQTRGREARGGHQQTGSVFPLSWKFLYATDLRSRSQGRGQSSMEPSHYVEMPKSITEKIIALRNSNND